MMVITEYQVDGVISHAVYRIRGVFGDKLVNRVRVNKLVHAGDCVSYHARREPAPFALGVTTDGIACLNPLV